MSEDYVTVTLKLPKEVVQFFRETKTSLEEGLVAELVDVCHSQIEAMTPELLIERYGLGSVFQKYGPTK